MFDTHVSRCSTYWGRRLTTRPFKLGATARKWNTKLDGGPGGDFWSYVDVLPSVWEGRTVLQIITLSPDQYRYNTHSYT